MRRSAGRETDSIGAGPQMMRANRTLFVTRGPDLMTTESKLERLYSLSELAAAGYANRSTLFRMVKDQRIPAVMVGRNIRVRESDLDHVVKPVEPSRQRP